MRLCKGINILLSVHKKIKNEESQISKNQETGKYLNKVFLGDIMDVLKKLPDKSVNMVFGDPDYNVGVEYGEKTYTKNFIVIIY